MYSSLFLLSGAVPRSDARVLLDCSVVTRFASTMVVHSVAACHFRQINPLPTLSACPLRSDRVRTFASQRFDAVCQEPTHAPQQSHAHELAQSITSSAQHRQEFMQYRRRVAYSALILAALMIGHHFSISAFCKAASASGVCCSRGEMSWP